MTIEKIVIIGGGIGGLATALAVRESGRAVVIIERDPEPPDIAPESAFEKWARPGVPQFRHAHILLARVQTTIRDHHPELLEQLRQAGIELSTVQESLPENIAQAYEPMADDGDLLHLWGRRPTFEYVVRRYVGSLPHVRFIHSARVTRLLTIPTDGHVDVRGVEYTIEGRTEEVEADIVVDASGKRTKCPQWLEPLGVRVRMESHPSGFAYACRHYRFKDPNVARVRREGGGNLDYLGYATFYAEDGNYALTFGCPVEEEELAEAIHRADGFDALCEQFPALKQWTSESDVKSKVLGAGKFENRWTYFGDRGGRELRGFFAVGDSHMETNPMYGRGCASAFVQAHVLAEVLDATSDPTERARRYGRMTRALLRQYFDVSVATDRMYRSRAKVRRGQRIPLGDRLLSYGFESAFVPATRESVLVAREFVKAQQMREVSTFKTRVTMALHIFVAWLKGLFKRNETPLLPPTPPRPEFLRRLDAARRASSHG